MHDSLHRGLLSQANLNSLALQLEQRPDGDDLQNALQQITGGRSVPRVFVNGQFIGKQQCLLLLLLLRQSKQPLHLLCGCTPPL